MKLKLKLILTLLIAMAGFSLLITGCSHPPDTGAAGAASPGKTLYTCGMHPWIIQDHPGDCPICGMKLEAVHKTAGTASAALPKIRYYQSTMMPGETSPRPAKDSMGMDMVPVYDKSATSAITPDSATAITIDPATIQLMNVQTTEVTRGPLRRTIRTVGAIDYNETALTEVTTRFKGWIEKLDADTTGQLVHRGEPLFEIYSPELYSAEAEYLAVLDAANDNGHAPLRESAREKLKFYDLSDAQITNLEQVREPARTTEIPAPMDGFVVEKNAIAGQAVEAGMKLYRLADLGIVWVFAQVYEQDIPYVQLGQEAVVKLSSFPDREFRGRVTYVYPDVDVRTRTARVRLEFENPGYFLKPGMFVSVQIASELAPSVVLVPDSAVLRSGERNTVFVALPGGKFDARTVVLGPEAENDMYQVISGVAAGERVVTSGQFMLDSESQLREAIQKMRGPTEAMADNSAPMTTNANPAESTSATNPENGQLTYVCPMPEHVSITYDHPGNCPICGMALVPVTPGELKQLQPGGKVLYYTCPMPEHSYVHADKPGKCPVCGMTLIPVMAPPEATGKATASALAPKPSDASTNTAPAAKVLYTCPMHSEVISEKPGQCPKCGMTLVPIKPAP